MTRFTCYKGKATLNKLDRYEQPVVISSTSFKAEISFQCAAVGAMCTEQLEQRDASSRPISLRRWFTCAPKTGTQPLQAPKWPPVCHFLPRAANGVRRGGQRTRGRGQRRVGQGPRRKINGRSPWLRGPEALPRVIPPSLLRLGKPGRRSSVGTSEGFAATSFPRAR